MPRPSVPRDYELAAQFGKLPGYALVGTREIAAMTGFAVTSIRQRKVALPPAVYNSRRKILWRVQDVREWLARLAVTRRSRSTTNHRYRADGRPLGDTAIVQRDSE